MDDKIKCSQCGSDFSASEMNINEGHYVCRGCQAALTQKLEEAVPLSETARFAGFWIRVGAWFLDFILLWVVDLLVKMIIDPIHPVLDTVNGKSVPGPGYWMYISITLPISITYFTWFVGYYGATPGKMTCGIMVINADGSPMGYAKAFGRYCAEFLSGFILCIGYFMVGFDKEKRALHDRICKTRVIYR